MKRLSRISAIFVCFFILFMAIYVINTYHDSQVHAMGDYIPSQQQEEFDKKQKNVERLMRKQPATLIPFSIDRYILDQRNTRFNDPTKMSYLYVNFMDGTWIQMTVIAKAASTSKRLSSPVQEYTLANGASTSVGSLGPAPDDMGTFGSSMGDKCAMTTIGSLIEFGGFVGFI